MIIFNGIVMLSGGSPVREKSSCSDPYSRNNHGFFIVLRLFPDYFGEIGKKTIHRRTKKII
jgi:hypothetical protein